MIAAATLAVAVGLVVWRLDAIRSWLVVRLTPAYVAPARAKVPKGRLRLAQVARGLVQITDLQFVPGQPDLLVALEKGGTARVMHLVDGTIADGSRSPVLLRVSVREDSELGLLGLAFHPDFPKSGRLFVNYNPSDGSRRTVVSEWQLRPADIGKTPALEHHVVLTVSQPYPNHDAGQLAFGPDGKLYVGLGDGGYRNDPKGHGQNRSTLLGSMLRLDVDPSTPEKPYTVPGDNPFVDARGVRPEIWAYGLRNPWRFSFDPHGRLIVADVGQDRYEEVDIVARGDNLGWNAREGFHCFQPDTGCRTQGLVDPIFEYDRGHGTSITGGYVVTSASTPSLLDKYVFGDFTSGNVWALTLPGPHLKRTTPAKARIIGTWPFLISTFGRDAQGRLYVADYADGGVHRFVER